MGSSPSKSCRARHMRGANPRPHNRNKREVLKLTTEWTYSGPEHIFKLRTLDRYMEGHKGFIAGGCFKNLFSGEKIKDIDVFFKSEADWNAAVEYFESEDEFFFYYESKNVKAFKDSGTGIVVELVRSVFGEPEDVLSKFDFSVTKFAYYKEESTKTEPQEFGEPIENITITYKAVYHPEFFEHLHLKRLIIDDQIPKPMSTFNRMLRYRAYGFIPCGETKIKLINAIRELEESEVLLPTNFYEGID